MPAHSGLSVPTTVNPFELKPLSFSWRDRLKMTVVGVVLFPARAIALVSSMVGIATISYVCTIGHDEAKPLPPWRRALITPIQPLARIILWSLGFWRIKVTRMAGSAPPGGMGVLAAAPHFSLMDPIVLAWLELPCSVSKKEVRALPVVGSVAAALQCIFVNRKDPESKRKTAHAIIERGQSAAAGGSEAWPPVLVFPEGTCTNGRALISFKAGAFLPGVPVQPVALRYLHGEHGLSLAACTDEAESRLLYAMLQLSNSLEVIYLPLHHPSKGEVDDKALFAASVRDELAAHLEVPTTAHSYEDVWLASKARRYGVTTGTVEVASLQSLFHLTAEGITQLLERFHQLDTTRNGTLGIDEFTAALNLHEASPVWTQRLFSFFDADESGAISYAEFVQGLAILSPNTSPEEKVKLAFLLCDVDASGGVSLSELLKVLTYAGPGLGSRRAAGVASAADAPTGSPPTSPASRPFLQRTKSSMQREFDKHDTNHDTVLDFDEFRAFVAANSDVLELSTGIMQDKLAQVDLLKPLQAVVTTIKRDRSK